MRRLTLTLLCLFSVGLPLSGWCQTPMQNKIRAGAQAQADNLLKGDYAKLVAAMYPPVLELVGGRDAMLDMVRRGITEMQAQGLKLDKVDIGQVSEPQAGDDNLFAIVPQTTYITGPKMTAEQPGYLLAISADKGETWYYFDGAALSGEMLKRFFPNFPASLKLPERRQPKVTPTS